jgi:prolipoprotein diacylglyceryltransferase
LWSLVGIAVLLLLEKRFNLRWGRMFAAYLMWYSFGRFFIEAMRLDPSDVFFGLRTNQLSALGGFLLGFALLMIQRYRHTGVETTGYMPGRTNKTLTVEDNSSVDESGQPDILKAEVQLSSPLEKD